MLLVAITGTEAITTPNQIHRLLALTNSSYMRNDTAPASRCRRILSDWGTKAPTVITEATVPIWLARLSAGWDGCSQSAWASPAAAAAHE